jgi:uncharacterized membrane protein YiaA
MYYKKIYVLPIFSALIKMAAVEEQQKKYTKFATGFAKRLTHHLNNLFIHQVSNLTLPKKNMCIYAVRFVVQIGFKLDLFQTQFKHVINNI